MRLLAWLFAVLAVAGCAAPLQRPLVIPLNAVSDMQADYAKSNLLILLPGVSDRAEDFFRRGLVAELRRRELRVDVIAVDAHLGYFRANEFHDRLRRDVIAPAQQLGYRNIWLAGISLGGFGALIYEALYPGEVQGVIAIAPFIAEEKLLVRVQAAGGLDRWQPSEPALAGESLLRWMKNLRSDAAATPVFLAYGAQDRLGAGHRLLAQRLPEQQVKVLPGRHRWSVWQSLWKELLGDPLLRRALAGERVSSDKPSKIYSEERYPSKYLPLKR